MASRSCRTSKTRWKRLTYTVLAPFYDLLAYPLTQMRRESIRRLQIMPGERVLIVGAGTGLDLEHLPGHGEVTAIDVTPAMLSRLRQRARRLRRRVDAKVMDAHAMSFGDGSFDAAILHLVLAVIPDAAACAREVARVLRPGGRAVILDKFVPDDCPVPFLLRAANVILDFLGTRVDRKLGQILAGSGLEIVQNEGRALRGYYRIVTLAKS